MPNPPEVLQDDHNQGEKDASEYWNRDTHYIFDDPYQPPSDPDRAEAYRQGWQNTQDQIFS